MTRRIFDSHTLWQDAKERFLSNSGPISSVQLSVSPFNHELYLAKTVTNGYLSYEDSSSGYDPDEVQFSALMKAVASRACFQRPNRHIVMRADQLTYHYLSPLDYAPLDEKRLGERSLNPFKKNRRIRWVVGATYDGHPVYVPEDLVYRGQYKDYLYIANDSGVAAHFDPLIAVKNAVMSRIRADACMRTWYKNYEPYVLDSSLLGEKIRSRIDYWHANGRELTLAQLDNDYGEVYLAVIRGSNSPCFVCGVGATIDGMTETAILEAIAAAEANFGLLVGFGDETGALIEPTEISTSLDHLMYYCDAKHAEMTDFLTASKKLSPPFRRPSIDIVDLMKQLDLVVCWLTAPSMTYYVARVFSRHLVPISYGYGLEHSTHEALSKGGTGVSSSYEHVPHCFYHP